MLANDDSFRQGRRGTRPLSPPAANHLAAHGSLHSVSRPRLPHLRDRCNSQKHGRNRAERDVRSTVNYSSEPPAPGASPAIGVPWLRLRTPSRRSSWSPTRLQVTSEHANRCMSMCRSNVRYSAMSGVSRALAGDAGGGRCVEPVAGARRSRSVAWRAGVDRGGRRDDVAGRSGKMDA